MHVTETMLIPIKQKSLGQHQVKRSEPDLAPDKTIRSVFIAPTLAEMMRDKKLVEATLPAIAAGENKIYAK